MLAARAPADPPPGPGDAPAVAAFGLATAAALVAGVALALWVAPAFAAAWTGIAVLPLSALAWWRGRRGLRVAAALACGIALATVHGQAVLAAQLPPAQERVDARVTGTVVALPRHEPRRTRFEFRIDDHARNPLHLRGRLLRVSWHDAEAFRRAPAARAAVVAPAPCVAVAKPTAVAPRCAIGAGTRWRLDLRLRAPRGLRNPGPLDSERHAFAARLAATGYVRDPAAAVLLAPAAGIDAWRERTAARIDASLAGTGAGSARFVRALALGDTRGLDDLDWDLLRANGLTHLIAISGFHVGLVAGFFALLAAGAWWLLPPLGRLLPRPQAAAIAALAGAAGYAAVAGFALPTVRTVLMVAVVVGARLWRRQAGVARALALAATAVLLVDPLAALTAGFWLSFAGVAWLAWCLPDARGGRAIAKEFLAAQMVATLGLLPISAALFAQASAASPVANLVAIPWWSLVVVPLALLGTGFEAVHAGAGAWPWRAAAWCFDLAWPLFGRLGGSPLALAWLPQPRWFAVPMATLAAFLLWPDRGVPAHGEAELVVFDVGQGLSALVRTRSHALLYDMGPSDPMGFDAGEQVVVPALHALGVRRLDRAIASHGDDDHAGGLAAVSRSFRATDLLAPEGASVADARPCLAGEGWEHDGVRMRLLHPPPHFPYLGNEASCVLRVETAHGAFLLTGDIGEAVEQGLVRRQPAALRAEVVVVAHHGSGGSSDPAFVAATGARHVLVPAGHGNRFNHPHPRVVARWRDAGAEVDGTAEAGALRLRFADGAVTVAHERRLRPRPWDAALRLQRTAQAQSAEAPATVAR